MSTDPSSNTTLIKIDVAILRQEHTAIVLYSQNHIVELDQINLTAETFKYIFYHCSDTFGINKHICNNHNFVQYITFEHPYRTINGVNFDLLSTIITNIENDLGTHRNYFTMDSLIDLTREMTNIKTLCHINCCSVITALTWTNIVDLLKNDVININTYIYLVISVMFKSANPDITPTIIRFNYNVDFTNYLQNN